MSDPLADQIAATLSDRGWRLAGLLGDAALASTLEQRAEQDGRRLAAILRSEDDHAIAETVADLVALEHGPHDPPPEWWSTPLGHATAASTGQDDASAVTPAVAAAMLGVSPPRIYQLRDAGKLDRHPDGGVTRASVLARVASVSP